MGIPGAIARRQGIFMDFCRDKINRAIAALFSTKQKTKPNYNYMWVTIELEESDSFSNDVRNYISEFKSHPLKGVGNTKH